MLLKGDKIKMVKPICGFNRVGDVFEVLEILESGIIRYGCDYGVGIMSYDEFESYFEKKRPLTWSQWAIARFEGDNAIYVFRTNGKRIELKQGNLKASASCHESDEFDLSKGLSLCLARLLVKQVEAAM